MSAAAWLRDLNGNERPAEWVTDGTVTRDTDPYMVRVPGFGVVMIGRATTGRHEWRALLVQPRADGTYGPGAARHPRDVVEKDGRLEIDLLPNTSGEDRIVVVVEP